MGNIDQIEDKRCVACQGKLVLMHKDVYLQFDTPLQLFPDGLSMDVYECENCHRLEFFNSSSELSPETEENDMVICSECGQEHSKYINCPNCLADKGFPSSLKTRTQKDEKKSYRKKNDVPWEF